jgi:hypothetical protein
LCGFRRFGPTSRRCAEGVGAGGTNFNRGELAGPPETSFRVLTPEVVLVSAHLQVIGQGLVGGGTLDRDNFSLRAPQRQDDGSWLIVSEMFQDANTETTYAL